jgi:predicted phosphoribosyltransferase
MLYEAGLSPVGIEPIVAAERAELARQLGRYRAVRPAVPLADRTVLLVDDGLTTGASAAAAARVILGRGARRVVMAVPVSSREAREALADDVDEIVCVETPPLILALDEWYEDFPEVSDDEVVALLTAAAAATASPPPTAGS